MMPSRNTKRIDAARTRARRYHNCAAKAAYDTAAAAYDTAAAAFAEAQRLGGEAYHCTRCGKWHVSVHMVFAGCQGAARRRQGAHEWHRRYAQHM